jgi:hypothetical protein
MSLKSIVQYERRTTLEKILIKCNAVLIAIAVSSLPMFMCPAVARAENLAIVNGGGGATLTTPDGLESPVRFGLSGIVRADGSAEGNLNFVFPPPFAQVWGAVPGVDHIQIEGQVRSGTVAEDGTIILEGTLTERDYGKGEGVVFIEEDVPFRIEVGGSLAAKTLKLQWCFLPVFLVEVTHGNLRTQP